MDHREIIWYGGLDSSNSDWLADICGHRNDCSGFIAVWLSPAWERQCTMKLVS